MDMCGWYRNHSLCVRGLERSIGYKHLVMSYTFVVENFYESYGRVICRFQNAVLLKQKAGKNVSSLARKALLKHVTWMKKPKENGGEFAALDRIF